jgi:ABC-type antimicrobial peptide transport system permease subunit
LTGRLQWKLETMNYVNGTPAVLNNNIVFGGCDGFVRIADAYTGREKDTIEIGTYIALGMTRKQVVTLFTMEGAMHAVLAAVLGAIYGVPLLAYQSAKGIALPVKSSDYGLAMADRLYPEYGLGLILSTIIIVFLTTTLVSYWPSRKISKMRPSEALRGKIQ